MGTEAFAQGYNDGCMNIRRNPYRRNTDEWHDWAEGFAAALSAREEEQTLECGLERVS